MTAAFENKVREAYPKNGKRENSRLRSMVILFVIVAIAATVADLRREPVMDERKTDFVVQAEQMLEETKTSLWLGGVRAQELMAQGQWDTMNDYARSTMEDAAQKLLGTPAVLYDWGTLKMEEIDRLWQKWETQTSQTDLTAYLSDAMDVLVAEQSLPGLEGGLWLAVTPDGNRYILAAAGELWAVCPAESLK